MFAGVLAISAPAVAYENHIPTFLKQLFKIDIKTNTRTIITSDKFIPPNINNNLLFYKVLSYGEIYFTTYKISNQKTGSAQPTKSI
jgi:hypothetical protein